MPKLDGLKEDLGYFKFCFGIVVATFIALVGWIATNYNKAELWLIIIACFTALLFALLAIFLNRKMRKIIKEIYTNKGEK
ncbi:hypothetical protein ACLI44_001711 [Campylobacter upsaliensis]|nr:hypothetical protein [Campylobacter upsaliensis]EAI3865163.1 hypothetical protein [Campylobacter jejuni]EAI2445735.1 hypothetical protein [Campylobacter upsaliensis]EAI5358441.1 hypothetical protein [Campylobacter upsaliensis]EAJ1957388.1 hypothetical protein [Campylobacter upsaliensis]